MLYYVKSEILFQNQNRLIAIKDDSDNEHKFAFDCEKLQNKQNNEKKEIVFTFEKFDNPTFIKDFNEKVNIICVSYSTDRKKTNIDDIAKNTNLNVDIVTKALNIFQKQRSVDFFINKKAEKFLTDQLDLHLHNILLNEKNKFVQARLDQLKIVKEFALKIISFIAQFENELVMIWNKPKFVLNSNYVITIDHIIPEIIEKISKHKNLKKQIAEWVELAIVEKNFSFDSKEIVASHLPIDTKYFKDIEIDILAQFDNLDEKLCGRLIHSENYQALNTLQKRYEEQVQCVYIDPPFNTGKDFEYIDGYQDSTWLTLMDNRFQLCKNILNEKGSFYLHLDENANYLGRMLFKVFNFSEIKEITFFTMAATDEQAGTFGMKNVSSQNFVQESQTIYYGRYGDSVFNKLWRPNRKTSKLNIGGLDLIAKLKSNDARKKANYDFYIEKYENKKLQYVKIDGASSEVIYTMGDIWQDILSMSQSTVRQHGENISFQGQKPEALLRRIIQSSSNIGDTVLDFFAGTGTTAAVAHKLSRKWIAIEQGRHFYEFYNSTEKDDKVVKKIGAMGRLKLVLAGDSRFSVPNSEHKRGSTLSKEINWQGGGFFKYYDLEQYENALNKVKYSDSQDTIFDTRNPFANYVFRTDSKLADVLEISKNTKGDENIVNLDFSKLYENIDFAETISLLKGKAIRKINKASVILADGIEYNYDFKNMSVDEKIEFVQMLKPMLWWGE
jgi:adenine specific DNA methylase Mod